MNAANRFTLHSENDIAPEPPAQVRHQSLRDHVESAMSDYFTQLDGQPTTDLYQMVLEQVESPLLEAVMAYTQRNQSRAAEMLGLNRGTLRKKLKQYNLL
ncbi:MAG: DNA-binding transcriptional regulator Fis [Porticoccaceae bacterium]|jgi:Fis family transcriptional regulator|nr:DNA-binding transcriptional regulator Fis [Porticoccaceae bacterium]HLS98725.1 DNA-binding transcriptional regulator Fis [Porticoccaceae bacterium]